MLDGLPEPRDDETGPYALLVRLKAREDKADALLAQLRTQLGPTRAEAGNLQYTLHRDRLDPTTFYFYESYRDLAAFREHLGTPYIASMGDVVGDYLEEDFQMTFLAVQDVTD